MESDDDGSPNYCDPVSRFFVTFSRVLANALLLSKRNSFSILPHVNRGSRGHSVQVQLLKNVHIKMILSDSHRMVRFSFLIPVLYTRSLHPCHSPSLEALMRNA